MTKKLIQLEPQFSMEFDLDSFLNSHLSLYDEDDDENLNSVPHRTIDEILNDSDLSVSSSPPSTIHRLASDPKPQHPPTDAESVSSTKSDESSQVRPRPNLYTWVKSGELSDDPVGKVLKPSPWLLGGMRTNAKPGAALAAAAAASRSMPTPHAAAIKSKRSAGSGIFQKALESTELDDKSEVRSNSNNDTNVGSSSEVTESNSNEGEVDFGDELLRKGRVWERETELEETSQGIEVSAGNAPEEVKNVSFDENLTNLDANDVKDNEFNNNVEVVEECQQEIQDIDENSHGSKHSDSEEERLGDGGAGGNDNDGEGGGGGDDDNNNDRDSDDDGELGSSITQLVEERIGQLESRRISKKAEKKLQKPLEIAEELEKKQASTALHWEEGAAAQPMRLEGVRRGSTTLGYFNVDANNPITRTLSAPALRRDHGSPQVLAVHSNYIAIGMARGAILVIPSKYSAHNADIMDAKMLILGLQGERSYAAVTSICFNQQGDLLLAGYADGHITVWDVQRSSVAKVITGEHTAPVVHTLFLGQDSQVTRQFKAVTGDSKGLVLLHSFSVVPLLNRFSIKTQCLLDGQRTGTVLSASPLLFDEFSGGASQSAQGNGTVTGSSIGGMMGGVVGGDASWKLFNEGSSLVEEGVVVFVTHQTALVVRLTPNLEVYAQLSKPDGVREGAMPCTAWKCTTQSRRLPANTENMPAEVVERVSLLAIAWDRKVQVAKLVKSELKVYGKWSLESAAIGVAWLDDQMLVVLTMTGQLCLFAKDGTVIHQTSFSVDGFGGDDLIAYHTHFVNIFGNPEKAYHNCVAVRGASVYVLGPMHLIVSRLLPWKERIQVLRRAGDWMGALNMAMTIYDGQAHGVVDLPRTLVAVQEAIKSYLVELLLSYVEEVFSYISVALGNQIGIMDQVDDLNSKSSSVHSEIKEQYTRVGGVAVEFCVHIKRTDILFDEIFSKFVAVQQRDTFLELLEPYILKDMLGSLPPEIMQVLVEHYSRKGWLQRVEQCVLHMDISSLDFNQVVRLCREHGLYSALVYLFNKGLDDFRSPLEELLVVLQNSKKEGATALGYRMLVYLKYCFSGLAFPPGQGTIPPLRLPSLRTELLQFLLEGSDAPNSRAGGGEYLNLYFLLELDTEATLDVLRCAFIEDEISKPNVSSHDSADANMELPDGNNSMAQSQNSMVQNTVDTLIHIVSKGISQTDGSPSNDETASTVEWPSKKDIGHLFEFIAYYVACGRANVSRHVLSQILEYLTSENNFPSWVSGDTITSKNREKQVLGLLEVVPETDWDSSYVLQLCEKARFYQVCGLIHNSRHQYLAALDCYMKDVDEPIHAFSFINKTLLQLTDNESAAFRSEVISRIPELFDLNREGTFVLVIDHFTSEEGSHILSELRSHPKSLFLYLKTVIEVHLSGTLDFSSLRKDDLVRVKDQSKAVEAYLERICDFPKLLRNNPVNVTDDMIELYLELLCQYERNSVLKFLETFDSYRVEHCLRLCQKYGITDAASFLLERVGDVGSALLLTLSTLNEKFIKLDTAVGSLVSSGSARTEHFSNALKLEEVSDINSILHACIGLCQRNTHRLNPDESEALWFRLLDSFCEPLTDSLNAGRVSKGDDLKTVVAESLESEEDEVAFIIEWRISKLHKGAHILRKVFSRFIKEIVEGMIGYVRLPTIMSKLLSDNGSQEFGDFKFTILGMLSTYGFERRILDTAKSLIEDDTFYTMSILKKGASHGYAPRSQICCICDCLLDKNSSSYIRIFNCGHATHLQCEVLENGTSSSSSSSGCPVCMPKKKSERSKNKSVLPEKSLVKGFSSRTQQIHGTTVHPHESNASENTYGLHQISRFEMLTNLQRDRGLVEIENMPQLRLSPPAVYHEKVQKGTVLSPAESSSDLARIGKQSKSKQPRVLKVNGSSLRFPLKSNIFSNGKEKTSKR
ncbi:PREDICTED: vacuolar protein sorting-associated protein 8 homolog [Prunus mume]|uniref:Vacuolar protein sorting-associated protein 8 homolog n=1 Tax=Prunus mume TaxID=102107 RepID=A0ABM0NSM0_PRUMU|nr:PREDICTED: vacuolar protein sorting-associated protein 8 homolog [Prunus mume]